jgi:hypothetical protein
LKENKKLMILNKTLDKTKAWVEIETEREFYSFQVVISRITSSKTTEKKWKGS